jgi:hypothetical protein
MPKNTLFVFLISLGFQFSFAQDGEGPITVNPDLFKENNPLLHAEHPSAKALNNSFDSTFIYITDTLSLPFFDEFSTNKFQNYNAEPTEPNVSDTLYYRMLDEFSFDPLSGDTELTETRTFRAEYDVQNDTTIFYYFDSIRFLYDDLAVYAPNYIQTYGFPPYTIYDTIGAGANDMDTTWLPNPEFVQDSARIFVKRIDDQNKLWLNDNAYHNYRYAKDPWTLGVVTFDGLDENGYPYLFGSTITGTADTLLSKPIDLSTVSPGDSIYFSFLYQKEGFGDVPEDTDSLLLEFYNPTANQWSRVWRTPGGSVGEFQVTHIPLTNPDYFEKGFQFRFMNYGSLAGGIDHFHIDYVNFRALSGYQDTLFKDFAFVYPIRTLLDTYSSVPWKHYRNSPSGKMSNDVEITVRNGSELTENNQNGTVNVYLDGSLEGSYTLNASALSGGNINYAPRTTYTSFHDFSGGYAYDHTLNNDTSATFNYEGIANAQFPNFAQNDSTFGNQVFENYYAYDDGTAERAYGLTGEQALLAHRFNAYEADSLVAVQIHFVPSVVDVSNNLFLLAVWDDNNGEPGSLLYEDEFFFPRQPRYESIRNGFVTYYFKDTARIGVGETFYIGMRQIDEERLNIGYDKNSNFSDEVFWSVDGGGVWNNASFPGALMMRPLVTSKMDYLLGVQSPIPSIEQEDLSMNIYPNPAFNHFSIETNVTGNVSYQLVSMSGKVLLTTDQTNNIDISYLQKGMYFISMVKDQQPLLTKKLVVQ